MTSAERQLEERLIEKLQDLKYEYRADIRDRAALEKNFRGKFDALNHVRLTDGEFQRLLEEIVTPDVFTAAKKKSLKTIIAHYNERFGTNHRLEEFDLYYQDVQQRIKDQRFPNADLPKKGREKLDVTIVVDMLLTGFDSKYLNTLYVDKYLKHHGLIQAFSRTNRVLNDTKPYGHILDFRGQREAVDAAIALFSGVKVEQARKIWLVDKAPVVIGKLKEAKTALVKFMESQGLTGKPDDVANLKGDDARAAFIKHFKEVQRLQTQLDQYTDLTREQEQTIESILPKDDLTAFRGQYLETAQRLREQREKPGEKIDPAVEQLDFEFVLFASAVIDYDYIMKLITEFQAKGPTKSTMSREQLIGLIASDSKFIDEREAITEYVRGLKAGEGLDEAAIRAGYQRFKSEKQAAGKPGAHHPALAGLLWFATSFSWWSAEVYDVS
jgi:type I restriction enzyme R subunit